MTKFNALQRFLRRLKPLRGMALLDLKRTRTRQVKVRAQYESTIMSGIGTLIFIWAGIERLLNSLICIYHPHSSSKLQDKPLPDSLNQKIQYLVEIGKDPRLPDHIKHKIREWIPKLGRLKEHRHIIVHGMMFQKNRGSTKWFAHRLKMSAGWPTVEEVELCSDDLNAKLQEISHLSQDMAETLNPVFFGPNWRDNKSGDATISYI